MLEGKNLTHSMSASRGAGPAFPPRADSSRSCCNSVLNRELIQAHVSTVSATLGTTLTSICFPRPILLGASPSRDIPALAAPESGLFVCVCVCLGCVCVSRDCQLRDRMEAIVVLSQHPNPQAAQQHRKKRGTRFRDVFDQGTGLSDELRARPGREIVPDPRGEGAPALRSSNQYLSFPQRNTNTTSGWLPWCRPAAWGGEA